MFSPHAWGCTEDGSKEMKRYAVFPTRVGVYLSASFAEVLSLSFPHTRGGVPFEDIIEYWDKEVFPTRVGVYLLLPHFVCPRF